MNGDVDATHPLVALIGATQAAIPPATAAFGEYFPEAELWNLIDDRLIVDAVAAGGLTPALIDRMSKLVRYAVDAGARGVLLTCSMYGPVAHQLASTTSVPVHASDDAAFEDVLSAGFSRILLLSSLPDALRDAERRFVEFVRGRANAPHVHSVLAESAFQTASRGDTEALLGALVTAIGKAKADGSDESGPDAILLAQYSLAPADIDLASRTGLPVIAGPPRAAAHMRAALLSEQS